MRPTGESSCSSRGGRPSAVAATRHVREVPDTLERLHGDRARLVGEVSATREQAGLAWNRIGMLGEVADLSADVVLERSGAGAPAAQPNASSTELA